MEIRLLFALLFLLPSVALAYPTQALTTASMSEVCSDGLDNDNSGGDAVCTGSGDNDRDGYGSEDCDDADRWVYPGTQQACGVDGTQTCSGGSFTVCAEGELDESTGSGTAYYIDATSGSDSNDCLTRATACAGFAKFTYYYDAVDRPSGWYGLAAGDVVYLMDGTYDTWYDVGGGWGYRIFMTRFVDGTAVAPIVIKAYPGETPIIDGSGGTAPAGERTMVQIEGSDHVHFEGIEFANSLGNGIYYESAVGAKLSNLYFHDIEVEISPSGSAGNLKFSTTDAEAHHILVGNFYDASGGGRNNVGIRGFYGNVTLHHIVVYNDLAFDDAQSGECVQWKHGDADPDGGLHIYESIFIGCSNQYAIASASPNTVIEDNLILETLECIAFEDVGGPSQQKNMVVRRNVCDSGRLLSYTPTKAYYDNTIGTLDISNNVVIDTSSTYGGSLGVIQMQNYFGGDADALYTELVTGGKITSNENCFYNGTTTLQFSTYPSATSGGDRTFAQWQSTDGFDANSYVEAPVLDGNYEASSANCTGRGWVLPVPGDEGGGGGSETAKIRAQPGYGRAYSVRVK